jgi:hypothetical protein
MAYTPWSPWRVDPIISRVSFEGLRDALDPVLLRKETQLWHIALMKLEPPGTLASPNSEVWSDSTSSFAGYLPSQQLIVLLIMHNFFMTS